MSSLHEKLPRPEPGIDDAGFWEACRKQRLVFRKCDSCRQHHHPPTAICPHCQSSELSWEDAHGPVVLYSFTDVQHPAYPGIEEDVPYTVAVVTFPEMSGVRLVTNLVSVTDPEIGRQLALHWKKLADGTSLPIFSS